MNPLVRRTSWSGPGLIGPGQHITRPFSACFTPPHGQSAFPGTFPVVAGGEQESAWIE